MEYGTYSMITWIAVIAIIWIFTMKKMAMLWHYKRLINKPVMLIKHPTFGENMICDKTFRRLTKFLRKNKQREACIVLHTDGGTVFDSIRCAELIHAHGNVTMIVPQKAMSGGTLMSMMAQRIVVKPYTVFGDLNPQGMSISFLKQYSEKSLGNHIGKKNSEDHMMLQELRAAKQQIMNTLSKKGRFLAERLTEGNEAHSCIVSIAQLREYGIKPIMLRSSMPERLVMGGTFG